MKKIMLALFIAVLFSVSGCSTVDISHIEISKVVVLDSKFNQVRLINQPEQLQEITKLWQQLKPIDKDAMPNTNWTHKLDIQAGHLSGRWLYNKQGYLATLSYRLKPMYKVEDPAAFNKLILGFE